MDKMLGKKAFCGICVCYDCGGIDMKQHKRIQKRREKRSWKREFLYA